MCGVVSRHRRRSARPERSTPRRSGDIGLQAGGIGQQAGGTSEGWNTDRVTSWSEQNKRPRHLRRHAVTDEGTRSTLVRVVEIGRRRLRSSRRSTASTFSPFSILARSASSRAAAQRSRRGGA